MSVDANVLIYERIREELRSGKSILAAIDAGFKRAWGTIIDSHLTQLIAAVVLYFLGTGPVQGFAVTLALGILTSLFTAYTVTLYFVGLWFACPAAEDPQDPGVPVHSGRHQDPVHEDLALRDHLLGASSRSSRSARRSPRASTSASTSSAVRRSSCSTPGRAMPIRQDPLRRSTSSGSATSRCRALARPRTCWCACRRSPAAMPAQQAAVNKVTDALQGRELHHPAH